ncbi:type II secretion system F family protein [Olsenella sp. HMSC062G07]|uniref:type II secretion system F family protein n=1 Tax=Olsenella sp. HMSC062G07 TaxID=1739330 RepID=UPI0008A47E61|nr:type II secretion system F family protein [Olsenella sp. HMSC062G07]OFK23447.1 hypothetical protein HMPREF2826_05040 [Olsenella sp. HMSC062G07]
MEVAYALSLAAVAWLCGFVLLGGFSAREVSGERRRARAERALGRLLWAVAGLSVPALLLSRPAWRRLSDWVCVCAACAGLRLERQQGCALVLCLWALCALSCHSLPVALVASACLLAGVPAWHASMTRRERRDVARAMPGVFRTLAMALGSGETLSQAISYVGTHVEGPAGEAFARASLRLSCGSSVEAAVGALKDDLDAPGMGLLASALVISQRTGSPLKGLFEYAARLVERQGEFERMLAVKTAQVRLSARVVSVLPVLLVGGLAVLSTDFRAGLMTPAGAFSLLLACAMDVTALLVIRRQMGGILS